MDIQQELAAPHQRIEELEQTENKPHTGDRYGERLKVLTQLCRLAKEAWGDIKIDWSNTNQKKYEIRFNHRSKRWFGHCVYTDQPQGCVVFPSPHTLLDSIETIEPKRLMLLLEQQ